MNFDSIAKEGESRDRGILTPDDRKYLRGEKEYSSKQSEIDARYRIRKRIKNAIIDFSIILSKLTDNDREQIFKSNAPSEERKEGISAEKLDEFVKQTRFVRGIEHAIGFLYLGIVDLGWNFEEVLEAGIKNAEEKRGYVVDNVSVNIEITHSEPNFEELIQKLQRGEGLTSEEMRALIRSGELDIDMETLDRLFERMSEDISEDLDEGEIELNFDPE
ncbi:hypothetical protein [Haloplanus aerogenes]|uniref:Domain of unknown function domain-containing protein n=1 Tax=Haloplanus aerogenes TaxID=660522 RepID=A0A3M0CHG6_9EURY|nr:hypothetical protein [Haloplanus aerogenes]AZH26848.1 hypothetical protein DU502_16350 [Haloplanus aerogenes]RMB09061.1 hypothetical protein ATH50_3431 [Haloplanus aerogenes]